MTQMQVFCGNKYRFVLQKIWMSSDPSNYYIMDMMWRMALAVHLSLVNKKM